MPGSTKRPPRSSRRGEPAAVSENVRAIKHWEQAMLASRTTAERVSDWIAGAAASGPVMAAHVVWFGGWVAINVGAVPGVAPFDPFPFSFLTMAVSLEAIFLALFVLASQNRLSRQADQRSQLDLQVDMLAEREMSAVLRLLGDIADHLKVPTSVSRRELADLAEDTDIRQLTHRVAEIAAEPGTGGPPKVRDGGRGRPPGRR